MQMHSIEWCQRRIARKKFPFIFFLLRFSASIPISLSLSLSQFFCFFSQFACVYLKPYTLQNMARNLICQIFQFSPFRICFPRFFSSSTFILACSKHTQKRSSKVSWCLIHMQFIHQLQLSNQRLLCNR